MPHEGYADPVTNDRPRFCSNAPVSELIEHVTRAIEASDVSSAPPVVETMDGVTHETRPTPTEPNGVQGLRSPDVDSGNQPTAQVAGGTNTGEHPERQKHKSLQPPEKSTKIFSLQPTHQSDAGSEATPAAALTRTRCQNKKFPH